MIRRDLLWYLPPALILLLALGLRLYQIDSPLWLDELYGYRLARLDAATIIGYSRLDPHPPLYYLLQWALSGGGAVRSPLGWRWFSLLCSLAALALSWCLAARLTDRPSGIMAALLMATSPVLVFYSQEARGYALLTLLAISTAWLVLQLVGPAGDPPPAPRLPTTDDRSAPVSPPPASPIPRNRHRDRASDMRAVVGWPSVVRRPSLAAIRKNQHPLDARQPAREPWRWVAWALLSLVGLYTSYSYSMLIGAQLVVLAWWRWRRPALWLSGGAVALMALPLSPLAIAGLGRVAAEHAQSQPLAIGRIVQTILAGEIDRYPAPLIYPAIPTLALALSALCLLRAVRRRDRALLIVAAQLALPLAAFAALSAALGLRMPQAQAKQFVQLTPLWFVLLAGGFAEMLRVRRYALGAIAAAALCGALVALNGVGLAAYWTYPKSPEGLAVQAVARQVTGDERVVSLHYAPVFSLALLLPTAPVYLNPTPDGASYRFWLMRADQLFTSEPAPEAYESTSDIRALGRFWLISHLYSLRDPLEPLIEGCKTTRHATFVAPNNAFEIMYVACPAPVQVGDD